EVIAALLAQAGLGLPVRLRAWDGSEAGTLDPREPVAGPVLVARSPRALQRILWRPGELGLARAYVSGDLDVEGDLTDGLRRVHATAPRSGPFGLIRMGPAAAAASVRLGLLAPPPEPPRCELRVRGRRHSRARDQAVIAGHYDVPSAFYQLILDPSMAYSCAYWDPQTADLTTAQRAKLELICRKLALEPGQTLLDMGCGWGSLTIHAARARVRVTGVTLSREQGGYVRRRARGLSLTEDRVQVRIQDYRDPLDGPYDAIASVEMGEHVGAGRYPAFCAALYGQLRPGGRLLIQQMSRTTRRGGGPFIESYIAPDMDMRPVGETIRLIQDAGFEVIGVEAMREHYARTIRAWLENFEANLPAITTILSAEQVRVWRLYLAGGALAFEQGRMGVDQILAQRPEW
ncbi:MAG TPA: cyclopropane-fatty-acyl-phospholipid synthase family protein, partial [Streptosporangiaceae bacterium]|nr:cyclopropane-fatty-acyl-phospholipid synthase family protein [Streptosporangiaceae bacterium]